MTRKLSISIIGTGRLGGALAIALAKGGCAVENLFARDVKTAERIANLIEPPPKILLPNELSKIASDVVLICTQDSEIENAAAALAESLPSKPIVFHTSGAFSSEILQDLKSVGCSVGSIHPLVSISDSVHGAKNFANAFFCVEGDDAAIGIAGQIVEKLGGKSFSIQTRHKTLYHAAAVTASGHLTALVDAAIEILTECGLEKSEAQTILLPLIKSTVENLETQNAAAALTGTFARADVRTLEKHIKSLGEIHSKEILEIYLQLGTRSLDLAKTQGANPENLEKMRGQILLAKKNLK